MIFFQILLISGCFNLQMWNLQLRGADNIPHLCFKGDICYRSIKKKKLCIFLVNTKIIGKDGLNLLVALYNDLPRERFLSFSFAFFLCLAHLHSHSFNKHFFNLCYEQSTVLSAGGITIKIIRSLGSPEACVSVD